MVEFSKYLKNNSIADKSLKIFSSIYFSINRNIFSYHKPISRNIVVISLHKLGDTVFTIPAIKLLLSRYGNNLIIYCFPESKKIYELVLKGVKYQIVNRNEFKLSTRIASFKARKLLKNLNPETIIDLTGSITTAFLLFSSKAKKIIGFNDPYFNKIYDDCISKRTTPHLINMYIDVISLLLPIKENDIEKEYQINFDKSAPILIYPFAGWKAKEWNLDKFVELCRILKQSYNCKFIDNNLLPEEIKFKLNENNIEIIKSDSIEDLISILNNCSLLISNDSGPIYIANILNKPTFTIYGPTNPLFHIPYGKYHGFIQKRIECSPRQDKKYCYTDGGLYCPVYECMNHLSLEEVKNGVINLIKEIGISTVN